MWHIINNISKTSALFFRSFPINRKNKTELSHCVAVISWKIKQIIRTCIWDFDAKYDWGFGILFVIVIDHYTVCPVAKMIDLKWKGIEFLRVELVGGGKCLSLSNAQKMIIKYILIIWALSSKMTLIFVVKF